MASDEVLRLIASALRDVGDQGRARPSSSMPSRASRSRRSQPSPACRSREWSRRFPSRASACAEPHGRRAISAPAPADAKRAAAASAGFQLTCTGTPNELRSSGVRMKTMTCSKPRRPRQLFSRPSPSAALPHRGPSVASAPARSPPPLARRAAHRPKPELGDPSEHHRRSHLSASPSKLTGGCAAPGTSSTHSPAAGGLQKNNPAQVPYPELCTKKWCQTKIRIS